MSKKLTAALLVLVMIFGCSGAVAENVKHERVYVVAGTDGSIRSLTDSIRLENRDGLEILRDKTCLTDLQNVGGKETFTLDGEDLTWQADGKDIAYQGTSDRVPALMPTVTLTMDGQEITAAELKERTGEAVLNVTWSENRPAAGLAVSVLPLPETGISEIETENAAVLNEMGQNILVGWSVPGVNTDRLLPASFSIRFHADHAELGWMITLWSGDPIELACSKLESSLGVGIHMLPSMLTEVLKAIKNEEKIAEVQGLLAQPVTEIAALNEGLKQLDSGAVQLSTGAKTAETGASQLSDGLKTLTENNEALNNGAEQIFQAILDTANKQIATSELAQTGMPIPMLTKENYEEILDNLVQLLGGLPLTGERLEQAQKAAAALEELKSQLDQVNTFVTGLKTYTDGVTKASEGADTLAAGITELSAGAGTLQETGTKSMKDAILGAEKKIAGLLLPYLENDLPKIQQIMENAENRAKDAGYDLRSDEMKTVTVYIIRTDF